MDVLCLGNQVERFGKPTWRRPVEAVEDRVGGNNHALALQIAAEHPGMQLYTKSRRIITALSLYICAFIHENAGNYTS